MFPGLVWFLFADRIQSSAVRNLWRLVAGFLVLWCAFWLVATLRDWLAWFSAFDQLVIMLFGVVVTVAEEWSKEHKALVVVAFGVLGLTGAVATIIEGKNSDEERRAMTKAINQQMKYSAAANARLGESLDKLSGVASETSRSISASVEAQQRLLGTANTIKALSAAGINTQTGGDSFCYLTFGRNTAGPQALRLIVPSGRYPLSDVRAAIFDAASRDPLNPDERLGIGSVAVGLPLYFGFVELGSGRDFNIQFVGKNAMWNESLRVRRVGELWAQKIRVTRGNHVLYEWADPDFPEGK